MIHTIRRYGQFEQVDCEFGSDTYDINGNEIVEGDILKSSYDVDSVTFRDGCFWFGGDRLDDIGETLEIIGHVRDLA